MLGELPELHSTQRKEKCCAPNRNKALPAIHHTPSPFNRNQGRKSPFLHLPLGICSLKCVHHPIREQHLFQALAYGNTKVGSTQSVFRVVTNSADKRLGHKQRDSSCHAQASSHITFDRTVCTSKHGLGGASAVDLGPNQSIMAIG